MKNIFVNSIIKNTKEKIHFFKAKTNWSYIYYRGDVVHQSLLYVTKILETLLEVIFLQHYYYK